MTENKPAKHAAWQERRGESWRIAMDATRPPTYDLMTITSPRGAPTLTEAARQLGVSVENMDRVFGVVPIDPEKGVYAVQVKGPHPRASQQGTDEFRGPWSNPRIEPFGPVKNGSN